MTVLLREAIGDRLRRARNAQHRTLREVSRAARVSLGYLSEVERGRKEASSELLAAICGALELPLAELLHAVAGDLGNGVGGAAGAGLRHEFDEEFVDGRVPAGVIARDFDRELDRVIEGGRFAPVSAGEAKAELRIAPALARRLGEPVTGATTRTLAGASVVAA